MCLAIPGRLMQWIDRDPLLAMAEIDFGGVTKRCHLACVPDAQPGDFVLVHAGVALAVINSDAARQTLDELARSVPNPLVEREKP